MSLGILLTTISAIALAITVTTDKLMVGDFYGDDPKNAWFVSSFLGTILGLVATAIAWHYFGDFGIFENFKLLFQDESLKLAFQVFIAGALVSLTLRSYFYSMSSYAFTTSVAIAIAATPIFVFSVQMLISEESWTSMHLISFIVTICALFGFEYVAEHDDEGKHRTKWHLIAFVALSTVYLVFVDQIFGNIERSLSLDSLQAALTVMPLYWLGFSLGCLEFFKGSVRKFVTSIFEKWQFVAIVLFLEIIGASFYFFEFFGLSEIDVTLVALITGAHIVFVWLFDIYIRSRFLQAEENNDEVTRILLFRFPTESLGAYAISRKTILLQFIFVVAALYGLSLWP